jgi:hypothetical protein
MPSKNTGYEYKYSENEKVTKYTIFNKLIINKCNGYILPVWLLKFSIKYP